MLVESISFKFGKKLELRDTLECLQDGRILWRRLGESGNSPDDTGCLDGYGNLIIETRKYSRLVNYFQILWNF